MRPISDEDPSRSCSDFDISEFALFFLSEKGSVLYAVAEEGMEDGSEDGGYVDTPVIPVIRLSSAIVFVAKLIGPVKAAVDLDHPRPRMTR